jgi:hypothetical protein
MPIDGQPVAGGNIQLEVRGGQRVAVVVGHGEGRYVSHFATCPNRNQHRIAPASRAGSGVPRAASRTARRPGADVGASQTDLFEDS